MIIYTPSYHRQSVCRYNVCPTARTTNSLSLCVATVLSLPLCACSPEYLKGIMALKQASLRSLSVYRVCVLFFQSLVWPFADINTHLILRSDKGPKVDCYARLRLHVMSNVDGIFGSGMNSLRECLWFQLHQSISQFRIPRHGRISHTPNPIFENQASTPPRHTGIQAISKGPNLAPILLKSGL